MIQSICGADCEQCGFGKNIGCKGCTPTNGCPFGTKCFIAEYIRLGGMEGYRLLVEQLTNELNGLGIPGMPTIHELFPINGTFVNLAYPMPSGKSVKLLDDTAIYLGNQVECMFNDGSLNKYFGLVAGLNFLLVSEYGENCTDPQIVVYQQR